MGKHKIRTSALALSFSTATYTTSEGARLYNGEKKVESALNKKWETISGYFRSIPIKETYVLSITDTLDVGREIASHLGRHK